MHVFLKDGSPARAPGRNTAPDPRSQVVTLNFACSTALSGCTWEYAADVCLDHCRQSAQPQAAVVALCNIMMAKWSARKQERGWPRPKPLATSWHAGIGYHMAAVGTPYRTLSLLQAALRIICEGLDSSPEQPPARMYACRGSAISGPPQCTKVDMPISIRPAHAPAAFHGHTHSSCHYACSQVRLSVPPPIRWLQQRPAGSKSMFMVTSCLAQGAGARTFLCLMLSNSWTARSIYSIGAWSRKGSSAIGNCARATTS